MATAIFDLSRTVNSNDEMQLKAQKVIEENEIQRQIMGDPDLAHLTPSPVPLPSLRRQSEVQLKVIKDH